LTDVVAVFQDHVPGPILFLLECRHAVAPQVPFRSATVVGAAKDAIAPARSGIELLIAARPSDHTTEMRASPFTGALVEALDESDARFGLLARSLYERVKDGLVGRVPCFAHARGWTPFALIPLPVDPKAVVDLDAGPMVDGAAGWAAAIANGERLDEVTLESEDAEAILAGLSKPLSRPIHLEEVTPPPLDPALYNAPLSVDVVVPDALFADVEPVDTMRSLPMPAVGTGVVSIINQRPAQPAGAGPKTPRDGMLLPPQPLSPNYTPAPPPLVVATKRRDSVPPSVRPASVRPSGLVPASVRPSALSPVSISPMTTQSPLVTDEPVSSSIASISVEFPISVQVEAAPEPAKAPPAEAAAPPPPEPEAAPPPPPPPPPPPAPSKPPAIHHRDVGDDLLASKDHEGALTEYRKALGFLGTSQSEERAELYVRLATAKWAQEKRKEAISNLDKALTLRPDYRPALEALVVLNVAEKDFKAVHVAEERLLATITNPEERFTRLVEFGDRWEGMGSDPVRARSAFERARDIREDDLTLLSKLRRLYEQAKETTKAIEVRRQMAELTPAGRERATVFAELATYCMQMGLEGSGIETYELAIDNDPSLLGPIDALEKLFAERQEWNRLEAVYRRALSRVDKLKSGDRRRRAAWSICTRLGILFRDHLEDPVVALAYFERAMDERPDDLEGHLSTATLARSLGRFESALLHLRHVARLKPDSTENFHDIFDVAQKQRQPDVAMAAASVTLLRGVAESREKFLYDEHKPKGNPPFKKAIAPESWDLLRDETREKPTEGVLIALAPAAVEARLETLIAEGKLPSFDPSTRQDALKSTVSAVRSLAWGSHFLGMEIPAIFVREDAPVGLVAIPASEPTVLAGTHALRGRSLQELAFLVGRHLAYHVDVHRMLLFYPSLEELTACFVTALAVALPDRPIPPKVQEIVNVHRPLFEKHINTQRIVALRKAVNEFEAAKIRPDLERWAASVERCATRAGLLLCGNLEVAASVLRSEPRGALDPDTKIADLCGFSVSESMA
ncbi:MAG TPA: hypothetical protein PK156_46520, partial [Polyangium sp.]|nr:hypothetical protein [Polyangium sp.]